MSVELPPVPSDKQRLAMPSGEVSQWWYQFFGRLRVYINDKNSDIETLQSSVTTLQTQVAALQAADTAFDTRMTAAETTITSHTASIADHETRIDALENP